MEKTCGICGKKYDGIPFDPGDLFMPVYDGSQVRLKIRSDEGGTTFYDADICNECANDIFCYLIDLEQRKKGEIEDDNN